VSAQKRGKRVGLPLQIVILSEVKNLSAFETLRFVQGDRLKMNNPIIYRVIEAIAKRLMWFVCRWKINGDLKHLPDGPVIMVVNHLSWVEIVLMIVASKLPRRVIYMAKEEIFESRWKPLLNHYAFPVRRDEPDRQAIRQAKEILNQGLILGIMPEGTRSRSAQLQPAFSGAAFIAIQNDAFILPIGAAGSEKVKERTKGIPHLFHRPLVTINIGQPFKLPPTEGRLTQEKLNSLTDLIMRRIAELLPEEYRGVYR
jgi:1-acyl-sn-glycerol-3-phosphate acyltransferase